MKRAESYLSDKDHRKWTRKVLVWGPQRQKWLREGITVVTYKFRDENNRLIEIEYDATYVKENWGYYVPGKYKYKKDGSSYFRAAFHSYNMRDLKIYSIKTIHEELE